MPLHPNSLYYGDNLEVLRNRDDFPNDSIDLIYLDPPFNSKRDYIPSAITTSFIRPRQVMTQTLKLQPLRIPGIGEIKRNENILSLFGNRIPSFQNSSRLSENS